MLKKIVWVFILVFITVTLASSGIGWTKYVSLREFGIKISAKNFYAKIGARTIGTVTDPNKARYIFNNVDKGNRVEVINLGNGNINIRNITTGEEITLDVMVTDSE